MKYSSELYAKALAECVSAKISASEEDALVRRFWETVKRHGDLAAQSKIISAVEHALRVRSGGRKVTVASARELSRGQRALLEKLKKPGDMFELRVTPEIIAGITITINDEEQFDGSLARKLTTLFK